MPTPDRLRRALLAWWRTKRPLSYTEAQHIIRPTVGCVGEPMQDLARHAARIAATEARVRIVENGNESQ